MMIVVSLFMMIIIVIMMMMMMMIIVMMMMMMMMMMMICKAQLYPCCDSLFTALAKMKSKCLVNWHSKQKNIPFNFKLCPLTLKITMYIKLGMKRKPL